MYLFIFIPCFFQMSSKYQDIPFLIDGTLKIVKSVTKNTTCSDVIDKLPRLPTWS